jgi:hypothetical protein
MKFILVLFVLLTFGACGLTASRPKYEMSLAQSAFVAAKAAKADEKSKTNFRKAELYYLKAKSAYRRKYFNKALQYAELSKKFSELAESQARLSPQE